MHVLHKKWWWRISKLQLKAKHTHWQKVIYLKRTNVLYQQHKTNIKEHFLWINGISVERFGIGRIQAPFTATCKASMNQCRHWKSLDLETN